VGKRQYPVRSVADRCPWPNPREWILETARGLPEAEIEPVGTHVSFRVRGRRFAWYLDDHHGDGRIALTCKAAHDVNDALVRSQPDQYFIPSYVGTKGWVGIWLDIPDPDWDAAAELLLDSYRLIAPKGLAKSIEARERPSRSAGSEE
jgi:hypothetical protein